MGNIFKAIGNFLKKVTSSDIGQAAETIYVDKAGALFQNALQITKEKDPQLASDIVHTLARWSPYLIEAAKKTPDIDLDDKFAAELEQQVRDFDPNDDIS